MGSMTRRDFTRHVLAAGFLPVTTGIIQQEKSETSPSLPDAIAGYTLTPEDKTLAAKFLAAHEKAMAPLRATDLPNSLVPSFVYRVEPPASKRKSGNG